MSLLFHDTFSLDADPVSAKKLHPNDVRKVKRAFSYFQETGHRLSDHHATQKAQARAPMDDLLFLYLHAPKQELDFRLQNRIHDMVHFPLISDF